MIREEFEVVVLAEDLPVEGLTKGMLGDIVLVHENPIWLIWLNLLMMLGELLQCLHCYPAVRQIISNRSERQVQWGSAQQKLNATFDLSSVISEYPQK